MKLFESNTLQMYGDQGRIWLTELPQQVNSLSNQWGLTDCQPVNNLSYNYVTHCMRGNQSCILKLGLDTKGLAREAAALDAFAGFGAVQVFNQQPGALLLERAIPGTPLKSFFPHKDIEAI